MGPANLDRANLRITGMDTYALVAAVLLQVLVGFYTSLSEPDEDTSSKQKRIFELQVVLLTIAVFCSTFTMVMFLLGKIYSVTALSMYKDVAYDIFHRATGRYRIGAFWSCICSMVAFIVAFALDLYKKMRGKRGVIATVLTVGGGIIMVREWAGMMLIAQRHIFRG